MPRKGKDQQQNSEPASIDDYLVYLYGNAAGERVSGEIEKLIYLQATGLPAFSCKPDQREAILITYGDQVRSQEKKPLSTLADFCRKWLDGITSAIHILPFFPYSSDDGFSVIDYTRVDPQLGTWEDIERISDHFKLMFDLVINHVSASSLWFERYLLGDEKFRNYFITVDGAPDLSGVTRPRALPLLTSFPTTFGAKRIWTTFSEDQIDLNFQNPEVLLEILKVLKLYVNRGAMYIRLDAIAYLWKEFGTPCIHLPQTHRVVQLLRAFLNKFAPDVQLITETNVPHQENISYFGDGYNEAQLVYNFALPPLILHTFLSGNARHLSNWVRSLHLPSDQVTFFNFLASHDGIGITPVKGIIDDAEFNSLVESSIDHGGFVSYKNNPDGSKSPYELNINYFDALSNPNSQEPDELAIARFLAAHAIMYCLVGVPGIYFHSLFGSRSWKEGVQQTGRYRTINRQKLSLPELESELQDEHSTRRKVFEGMSRLLRVRRNQVAFDPYSEQNVLDFSDSLFAVVRKASDPAKSILCVQNIRSQSTRLILEPYKVWDVPIHELVDLISGKIFKPVEPMQLLIQPYQTLWLGIHMNTEERI